MIAAVARFVFPFALAVAFALWAKSYVHVGDGFSAGAVAGLGAILQYVGLGRERAARVTGAAWAPALMAIGLVVVLALVFLPVALGLPPLSHFPRPGAPAASVGVLEVHTAAVFDAANAAIVYGALVVAFDRLFPHFRGDVS